MAQMEAVRFEDRAVPVRARVSAVRGIRVHNRVTRLTGALVSVGVGGTLLLMPGPTRMATGVVFGVQFAVQGVLQLFAAREARVPRPVRWLLAAGGGVVLFLAVSFFRGHADSVFLLGLWTGFGLLLRGFTMAVSMMPSSVVHVVAYDDLLNAVIVSAGLFMTAFPFSSLGQLASLAGLALLLTGLVEAVGACRRPSRTVRPLR
ncbi:hypothetical protein AQJ11_35885 [Streptomyces corchorusii]|uniref:Integral membrane protein n=2 Tax=Streptomyces TaxID=1883 RepID=A0A117QAR0_STRCK|nr:DUF308 domain-containing protein [Streptomyces corchorusii]AEY86336.1 hypothetical protein SHJG_1059 [Streptomyces hygroscopicus subsp. jinggangensis 5008]AGF60558.1 hypothetical protein SHJGH_0892 [Streptomyces hygroscopicus subsp. jinggangensis TL01]ALO99864.1 hypothetical protein SHL15_8938 [Streptomyces hygroscopicus subsp. limoneus]KUN18044.1 hypothetical protein AQJ11_35885 [Streptomyces corchorusii]